MDPFLRGTRPDVQFRVEPIRIIEWAAGDPYCLWQGFQVPEDGTPADIAELGSEPPSIIGDALIRCHRTLKDFDAFLREVATDTKGTARPELTLLAMTHGDPDGLTNRLVADGATGTTS